MCLHAAFWLWSQLLESVANRFQHKKEIPDLKNVSSLVSFLEKVSQVDTMHSPVLECTACLACSPKDNKGRKDKIGAKVEGLQNLGKIYVK